MKTGYIRWAVQTRAGAVRVDKTRLASGARQERRIDRADTASHSHAVAAGARTLLRMVFSVLS
jgi:hypothetical protein